MDGLEIGVGAAGSPDPEERLQEMALRVVAAAGLELVELVWRRSAGRRLLRLDIDRAGPHGVTLEECRLVSRNLAAELDEDDDDLVAGSYVLEVSSPGIDRPIRSADDIRRNTGRRVVVTTTEPIGGRRKFHGVLLGGDAARIRIAIEGEQELEIPFQAIAKARQEAAF